VRGGRRRVLGGVIDKPFSWETKDNFKPNHEVQYNIAEKNRKECSLTILTKTSVTFSM
jgi:hypothetical protein